MRVVLAGGSGQVGTLLARHFHSRGDHVTVLARTTYTAPWNVAAWSGESTGPWVDELENSDVLINLAGRSVNCRYGRDHRREILTSRLNSTRILGEAIRSLRQPPNVWLNASTATIYRHAFDRDMDEASGEIDSSDAGVPDSWRFSIEVAKTWEEMFFNADTPHTRKVAMRSAMTMSPDRGGVFEALLRLARFGLGGVAGSGHQFVSWIHEFDSVRAVDFLIAQREVQGPVNIAAPNPLRNAEFMAILREECGIRFGLDAKPWMLELGAFALRTETELVLKSRRVVPRRLLHAGFQFEFAEWKDAARELVARWRQRGKYSSKGRE